MLLFSRTTHASTIKSTLSTIFKLLQSVTLIFKADQHQEQDQKRIKALQSIEFNKFNADV